MWHDRGFDEDQIPIHNLHAIEKVKELRHVRRASKDRGIGFQPKKRCLQKGKEILLNLLTLHEWRLSQKACYRASLSGLNLCSLLSADVVELIAMCDRYGDPEVMIDFRHLLIESVAIQTGAQFRMSPEAVLQFIAHVRFMRVAEYFAEHDPHKCLPVVVLRDDEC